MSNAEWVAYVAIALAYTCAFYYSISQHAKTKTVVIIAIVMSVIIGAAWIVTMPMFSLWSLIYAGQRARA